MDLEEWVAKGACLESAGLQPSPEHWTADCGLLPLLHGDPGRLTEHSRFEAECFAWMLVYIQNAPACQIAVGH